LCVMESLLYVLFNLISIFGLLFHVISLQYHFAEQRPVFSSNPFNVFEQKERTMANLVKTWMEIQNTIMLNSFSRILRNLSNLRSRGVSTQTVHTVSFVLCTQDLPKNATLCNYGYTTFGNLRLLLPRTFCYMR